MPLDLASQAEMSQEQALWFPGFYQTQARVDLLHIDVGRRRRWVYKRVRNPDASRVTHKRDFAVTLEVADVVGSMPRSVQDFETPRSQCDFLAAIQHFQISGGNRVERPPEPLYVCAENTRGALQQALRIDEVCGAFSWT
jgi:hypothetical protein